MYTTNIYDPGEYFHQQKHWQPFRNFLFYGVHTISFRYENTRHQAIASRFVERKNHWYRITLPDGRNFVILPDTKRKNDDKIIWRQQQIPGEPVHPEEFIQSVGQGLQLAGLQWICPVSSLINDPLLYSYTLILLHLLIECWHRHRDDIIQNRFIRAGFRRHL